MKLLFQLLAPTDPKSLSGSTPEPFQLKIMAYRCDVWNLTENTWILFKKPKHKKLKFNIEIPIQKWSTIYRTGSKAGIEDQTLHKCIIHGLYFNVN